MITVDAALRRSLRAAALLPLLVLGACVAPPKKSTPAMPVPAAVSTPAPAPAIPPAAVAAPLPEAPTPFDLEREDIRAFIDEVSAKNSIPAADVRALLAQGMRQPRIIAAITRPAESEIGRAHV